MAVVGVNLEDVYSGLKMLFKDVPKFMLNITHVRSYYKKLQAATSLLRIFFLFCRDTLTVGASCAGDAQANAYGTRLH